MSIPTRRDRTNTSEIWIKVDKMDTAFQILTMDGRTSEKLEFGDSYERLLRSSKMLDPLAKTCVNLESFSIHENQTITTVPLIELFGNRMTTLEFYKGIKKEVLLAVSLHCTSIWKLTLRIRSSDVEGLNLWESIGRTLEILNLALETTGEEEMRKIKKCYRRLTTINIHGSDMNECAL